MLCYASSPELPLVVSRCWPLLASRMISRAALRAKLRRFHPSFTSCPCEAQRNARRFGPRATVYRLLAACKENYLVAAFSHEMPLGERPTPFCAAFDDGPC